MSTGSLVTWLFWTRDQHYRFSPLGLRHDLRSFPIALPVTNGKANETPLMWAAIVSAMAAYHVHGKNHYPPSARFVQGRKRGPAHMNRVGKAARTRFEGIDGSQYE